MPVEKEETCVQKGDDFRWEVWTYSEAVGVHCPAPKSVKGRLQGQGEDRPQISLRFGKVL